MSLATLSPTAVSTVDQLRDRLAECHARIGFAGRFSLTLDQDPLGPCTVTHWVRPGRYAPLKHRHVALGSLDECLVALDAYVEEWQGGTDRPVDRPIPAASGQARDAAPARVPAAIREPVELPAYAIAAE